MTNPYEIKYNLIVESCRIEPDHNKIQNYIGDIDDWSSLLNISCAHGVLPLVYKALKKQKNIPQEALNMFKIQNMQIAQKNIQMTAELIRIVKLFDKNDIKYMAIKGPVLSQLIHGNTIERQYADLDLLVEKKYIYRIGELLYENGYTSEHDLKFLKNKTLLKIGKDFTFDNQNNNIYIEIHWNLFLKRHLLDIVNKDFYKQVLPCEINSVKIKTLSLEYLLIYLCLHGSKHYWERIEWIADIDKLITFNDNINWDRIQDIVLDTKVENMFYLGIFISQSMFDTKIPNNILTKIEKIEILAKSKREIYRFIYSNDIAIQTDKSVTIKNLEQEIKLKDNKVIVFKHFIYTLLQINEVDIYIVNLPYILSPFYYLIRLHRMILKNIKN